jgi:hypothetical protein
MMDSVQREMARATSDEYEGLNQSAVGCGVITIVMVEVAHVPPSVGITAPEEARVSSGESKYVAETRRMARRSSALNSDPFPGDCFQSGIGYL